MLKSAFSRSKHSVEPVHVPSLTDMRFNESSPAENPIYSDISSPEENAETTRNVVKIIRDIDGSFSKCKLGDNITVFRGETSVEAMLNRERGSYVANNQFLSCSLDIRIADNFSIIRDEIQNIIGKGFIIVINIPAGINIIPVYRYSSFEGECELLLPRTTNIVLLGKLEKCVDIYGNARRSTECSIIDQEYLSNEECRFKITYIFTILSTETALGKRKGLKHKSLNQQMYEQIIEHESKSKQKSKQKSKRVLKLKTFLNTS